MIPTAPVVDSRLTPSTSAAYSMCVRVRVPACEKVALTSSLLSSHVLLNKQRR